MSDTIAALTLTDAEKARILQLFGSAEEFTQWQRDTLASEIEARAARQAQQQAQTAVGEAVQDVRDQFPTIFRPPT